MGCLCDQEEATRIANENILLTETSRYNKAIGWTIYLMLLLLCSSSIFEWGDVNFTLVLYLGFQEQELFSLLSLRCFVYFVDSNWNSWILLILYFSIPNYFQSFVTWCLFQSASSSSLKVLGSWIKRSEKQY